jgi:hypothetical protein
VLDLAASVLGTISNWYAFHQVLAKNRQQGFCWRM